MKERFSYNHNTLENNLYWISIIVITSTAILYFIQFHFLDIIEKNELTTCLLKTYFGINCPGCGGTRAFKYLIQGDLIKSLYYNAFSTYLFIMYGIFFITHTLNKLTKGLIKGLRFRMSYLWIGIIILIVQYLLKLFIPGFAV